jgi:hypothetical protein
MKIKFAMLIFFSIIFSAPPISAAIIASSSFDTGTDGWTWQTPASAFSWQSTGGNPGGYILFDDNKASPESIIYAPTQYLGDWNSMGVSNLSYEVNVFTTGSINIVHTHNVWISGPGGSAYWPGPQPNPSLHWRQLNVPISSDSWVVTSGSWESILADVTQLSIDTEWYNNWYPMEITGIDNISLNSVNSVPVPPAVWLLGSGIVGLAALRRKVQK